MQQELLELTCEEQAEWLAYHKLIGNKYYRSGNITKAIEVYMETLTASKILKDDSATVTVLCNLASCMISQGQAQAAVNILKEALAMQPGHPRALERRAFALCEMGMLEEAEEDLKNGIKSAGEKNLVEKMKQMLLKVHADKRKNKEMYKKMVRIQ